MSGIDTSLSYCGDTGVGYDLGSRSFDVLVRWRPE
jgi:hypothetical protein